jgi:hypothetical protein
MNQEFNYFLNQIKMKKSILKVGEILSKTIQKEINGGRHQELMKECSSGSDCSSGICANFSGPDCEHTTWGCGKQCL